MKPELVLLFILDVFKSSETEFRHHQQDRYSRENITVYPWLSTTFHKVIKENRVTEVTNVGQEWTVTVSDENRKSTAKYFPRRSKGSEGFRRETKSFFDESSYLNPTKSILKIDDETEKSENQTEVNFSLRKSHKGSKGTNKFFELENSKKSLEGLKARVFGSNRKSSGKIANMSDEFHVENSSFSRISTTKNHISKEKMNSKQNDFLVDPFAPKKVEKIDGHKNLNGLQEMFNPDFAQPLVALKDETRGCEGKVVQDFFVTDEIVSDDVLMEKSEAEKMALTLLSDSKSLNEITEEMETVIENHQKIVSISVRVENDSSKTFQTVYRKNNKLTVDRRSGGEVELQTQKSKTWTPLLMDCLTNNWLFGYYVFAENEKMRADVTFYFSLEEINGTVDQCNPSLDVVLNGGPKCDATTTECVPIPNQGFTIGGYKCVCLSGYHLPSSEHHYSDQYYTGFDLENGKSTEYNSSHFRCVPCLDSCTDDCSIFGFCDFQRNHLLKNSILSIQVFCILTTSTLTILVFKHRKCKTIATGMWTIMEMILLGSIILYGTIIIRAFHPSPILCLIEPWCREIGFVLCYGAIILKLYRILIEFRTRKAHRWVIRDKDLLKYLFGMVIVVFGYMSAWTAMNLNLIQKENYSMLTTGMTTDGIPFKTCKAAWWSYVTETSEILILVFGIHISYVSRNATTQFRERCFLCISITVEAIISGIFYTLRYFYRETTMHPDTSFVAHFTRCQLTTTVVLLLLFGPKWWYQKVQIHRGRVSRNYLMQESGRGPLEAFKPQDGVTATNSDVECEISLAEMNPEDIRAELKRLYTQLEVLKNKTIRFDNPHISKRRGGRKIAHRRFSLQDKFNRANSLRQTLRQQAQRLSARHATDVEVTEAEPSRTPEDSVCSNEGPSIIINDGPSDIVHTTPRKNQK